MGSTGKRVAAGLLMGLGKGMVDDANQKRESALKKIEREFQLQRDADDRAFRAGESEKDRTHRAGLLSTIQQDEEGNSYGITADGQRKDLGFKGRKSASQLREERLAGKLGGGDASGGISAEDDRLLKRVIERNTSGYSEQKETDWDAVDKTLREEGRNDLADYLKEQDTGPEIDVESPEWREAQSMAEEWAKGRTGLFSSRKSEFPETGGNMPEAIQKKQMEFYEQLTGKKGGGSQEPEAQASGPDPAQPDMQGKPSGSGTKENPYQAQTQADIDWFKANAREGDVILVNGQLFTM